jgi:hypothetical protein
VTDTESLEIVQRLVLEAPNQSRSWINGIWSQEEVLAYLTEVQRDFVRLTHIVRGWQDVDYTASAQVELPQEIFAVLHADTFQGGSWRPCPPVSRLEADQLYAGVQTTTRPIGCLLRVPGTRMLELTPAPTVAGRLQLYVVPLPQPCRGESDPLTVGDMWVPFLLAGVLARMFGRPGAAHDPLRRDRWHGFYMLGVQAALRRRTLTSGV